MRKTLIVDPINLFVKVVEVPDEELVKYRTKGAKDKAPRQRKGWINLEDPRHPDYGMDKEKQEKAAAHRKFREMQTKGYEQVAKIREAKKEGTPEVRASQAKPTPFERLVAQDSPLLKPPFFTSPNIRRAEKAAGDKMKKTLIVDPINLFVKVVEAPDEVVDELAKAGKEGLTPKKVSITRGGKTFQQTVYVGGAKPSKAFEYGQKVMEAKRKGDETEAKKWQSKYEKEMEGTLWSKPKSKVSFKKYSKDYNNAKKAEVALKQWFPGADKDIKEFIHSYNYADINWDDKDYSMGLREEFSAWKSERTPKTEAIPLAKPRESKPSDIPTVKPGEKPQFKQMKDKPDVKGFVADVENIPGKGWKMEERINDWLEGGKDQELDKIAREFNVSKRDVERHLSKEYY